MIIKLENFVNHDEKELVYILVHHEPDLDKPERVNARLRGHI